MDPDFETLMQRYFAGSATEDDVEKLDGLLAESPELRKRFLFSVETDAALREISLEEVASGEADRPREATVPRRPRAALILPLLAGCAALALLAVVSFGLPEERPVAALVSSEAAAWESDLPTAPGSDLRPGYLKLRSGMATIRFRSGVEVRLEAPAHLVLQTPMRGVILAGTAVIDVPEEAIGFVMETPGSFAVDHGTSFSVSVDADLGVSEYEVLSGEISVHTEEDGAGLRLTESEMVRVGEDGEASAEASVAENGTLPQEMPALRLGTDGKELTVIRDSALKDRTHPDFLMAKKGSVLPDYDRESLFAYDLSELKARDLERAELRLNLVPCGLGFAARLPELSTFSVYGIRMPWIAGERSWEEVPHRDEGELLGSFSIPRSQQTGSFVVGSEALRAFVSQNAGSEVTFLLVRDSDEALGNGLVHAFASSRHPEASGPTLSLW